MKHSSLHRSGLPNGVVALLLAVPLSACMVGPDYHRPDVEVPSAWRLGATEAGEISNMAWWEQFQDPVLSDLVRTALENNKDLEFATANVDQAAAQYGITRSAQFPQVSGAASATRERISQTNSPRGTAGRTALQRIHGEPLRQLRVRRLGQIASRDRVGTCQLARQPGRQGHGDADGRHLGCHRLHPAAGAGPAARDCAAYVGQPARSSAAAAACASRKEPCPRATTSRPNRSTARLRPRCPSSSERLGSRRTSSVCCSARIPDPFRADGTSMRCSSPQYRAGCRHHCWSGAPTFSRLNKT